MPVAAALSGVTGPRNAGRSNPSEARDLTVRGCRPGDSEVRRPPRTLMLLVVPVLIFLAVGGTPQVAATASPAGPLMVVTVAPSADDGGGMTHDHGGMPGGQGMPEMGPTPDMTHDHGGMPGGQGMPDMGPTPGAAMAPSGAGMASEHAGMPGGAHDMPLVGSADRPRVPVLGTFAAVNLAVLAGAAMLRRRTGTDRSSRGGPRRATSPTI
jgi:hypothetical protein